MVGKSPGTNWLATSWLKLLAKRFLEVMIEGTAVVVAEVGVARDGCEIAGVGEEVASVPTSLQRAGAVIGEEMKSTYGIFEGVGALSLELQTSFPRQCGGRNCQLHVIARQ